MQKNLDKYIIGNGEMAERIRSFDWNTTGLGPIPQWPQSLLTSVNIVLQSPVPLVMLWGKDGIMIYNDAYSIFAGKRHPFLLGSKVVEGWPEVADFNRNVMKHGLKGKTLSYTDQQLTLYRNNVAEEVWMNLNYSPIIDESGKPAGVLAIVVETTQRIYAEQKQKKAEEALQSERDRLQSIFMQAPAIIAILRGKNHVFELANELYMQLVGPERKIIGLPVVKALPEVKRQGFIKLLDTVYATGKPYIGKETPVQLARKDGKMEKLFVNFVYHPLKDSEGNVEGIFVHAVDVTEQVLTRKKIEESEEKFRTLIEKSTDAIQMVTPKGQISYTSESIKNVLGFTPEELQGKDVTPYLHPEDLPYFMSKVQELLKHPQKPITIQYRVRHKDGSWAWLETIGVNHLKTPNIHALVGTFRNITEERKQQTALKTITSRYQKLFNSSLMGIFVPDFNGVIHEANDVFLKMMGYTKKDLKEGKVHWDKMTPDEYKELDKKKVDELLKTGEATPWEKVYLRKDGTPVQVLVGVVVIEESSNMGLAFALDISERKRLERQKDDFLAIASHELKTPVTSIKAYTQALESMFRRKNDTITADKLSKMDAQVDKLSNLIHDLLDVTKIHAGRLQFHRIHFPSNELVEETVEEVQRTTTNHHIKTKLDRSVMIYGDRERIGQVLLNFLTNAIKYSPQANVVKVATKVTDTHILFAVRDYGVGIPKEKQDKVFDQFFRVEGPKNETYPGLGLGLYISKEIIMREKGTFGVKSIEGKGSTFTFSLPLSSKKPNASQ